jgi:hypothetical protein
MKHKLKTALLSLLLVSLGTQAQTVNKTYYLSNYYLWSQCVAPKPNDSLIFMSANVFDGSSNAIRKLLLSKTDDNGNFLQSILIDTPFYDHRIRETSDGVLLAAREDSNLYVMKFDNMLNNLWSVRIFTGAIPVGSAVDRSVDIEVGHDMGQEVYYFTSIARSFNAGYVNTDVAFSVVKLTNNGQLIWHKTYADPNRSIIPITNIYDAVQSIALTDNGDSTFVVAGARGEYDATQTRDLFVMRIDENGNIINNYRKITTAKSWVWNPDVIWDPFKNQIACAFNEEMGVMVLNMGLVPTAAKYFEYLTNSINIANTIELLGDSSYVVGAHIRNAPSCPSYTNPSFLKLDPITLGLQSFTRYNINHEVRNYGYHRTTVPGYSYMVPFTTHNNSGQNFGMRLLKVDPMLYTCGAHDSTLIETPYTPNDVTFNYEIRIDTIIDNFIYTFTNPNLDETTCVDSTSAYYKTGNLNVYNAGMASGIAISVNPTVLQNDGQVVRCDIVSNKNKLLQLEVYNILGQVSYRNIISTLPGKNQFNIPAEGFSKGMNMVRIYVDNKPAYVSKILKLD